MVEDYNECWVCVMKRQRQSVRYFYLGSFYPRESRIEACAVVRDNITQGRLVTIDFGGAGRR